MKMRSTTSRSSQRLFSSLRISMFGVLLSLTLSTLVTSSGCNFVPKASSLRWPWSKDKKKPLPDRIVPVWTDTVLYQPNQPGVRGFGGRVYFYLKDDSDPMEVDGGLAIYVFDADNEEYDQKPLRKFAFTPDQFANQMSKTSIGPSYSIWLPWGEVGGPPRRLSLIARFEGSEGGTVISDPTIKLLPGVISRKENQAAAPDEGSDGSPLRLTGHASSSDASSTAGVNHAAYSAASDSANPSAEQLRNRNRTIGTIDLPPSFQRHLFHNSKSPAAAGGNQASEPSQLEGEADPAAESSSALGASSLGTSAGRSSLPETSVTATPVTTQVIDHRSRTQRASQLQPANHTVTGEKSKIDIRTGRWIEAPSRTRQP